jgi:hypothetical protein
MARPIKKRTAKSYTRDAEHLNRLRMAIRLDPSVDADTMVVAFRQIEALIETLSTLALSAEAVEDDPAA